VYPARAKTNYLNGGNQK